MGVRRLPRVRVGARVLVGVGLVLLLACGDDEGDDDDDSAPTDGADFTTCSSNADCASGYCAELGSLAGDPTLSVCSAVCSSRDVQDTCPDGFVCQLEDGIYWCAPTCTSHADCADNPAHSYCQPTRGVCVGSSSG